MDEFLATHVQSHPASRDYPADMRDFVLEMPLSHNLLRALHDRHLMRVLGEAFERQAMPAMRDEDFRRLLRAPRHADYQRRFIADTLLSVLGTWVGHGFAETPEELADVLAKLVVTV